MVKKKFFNFFFILTIFFIDRLSKFLIIEYSDKLGDGNLLESSFLNFNLIWNDGIAFGLLSFDHKNYYDFITFIIILITLIILWMIIKTKKIEKLGFMMIFGGSLGNIYDRLYYSAVPDFIDLHINNFHWFIFNVADIFISLGVFILIYYEIFLKKNL